MSLYGLRTRLHISKLWKPLIILSDVAWLCRKFIIGGQIWYIIATTKALILALLFMVQSPQNISTTRSLSEQSILMWISFVLKIRIKIWDYITIWLLLLLLLLTINRHYHGAVQTNDIIYICNAYLKVLYSLSSVNP